MAVKRGPGGIPEEVPTVAREEKPASESAGSYRSGPRIGGDDPTIPPNKKGMGGDEPTLPPEKSQGRSAPQGLFPEDPPTQPPRQAAASVAQSIPDEPPTVIGRGRRRPHAAAPAKQVGTTGDTSNAMNDPVAGWLMIVAGPGKGNFVTVGYGQNSIGRSVNERITLNFGDGQISSNNHAVISYDPRGGKFYIQQGSGTNFAYLNDAPVLAPTELESNSTILLGETTLRFVAFCGTEFNWEMLGEDA